MLSVRLTAVCLLAASVVGAQDGELDPTFSGDGVAYLMTAIGDSPDAVATDGAGRIVVASSGISGPTSSVIVVARFTAAGSLDSTFDGDGVRAVGFSFGGATNCYPSGIALQPDGRIVVAGRATSSDLQSHAGALIRLMPDGSLDSTLDGDGILVLAPAGQNHRFYDVVARPNGNLVVSGAWDNGVSDAAFELIEYSTTGGIVWYSTVDLFPSSGDVSGSLVLEPDGRVTVASSSPAVSEMVVTRWDTTLQPDTTFGGDGAGHYPQDSIVLEARVDRLEDGRYVIGARINGPGLTLRWLLPNGAIDGSACGTSPFCSFPNFENFEDLVAQSDGRILVVATNETSEDVSVTRFLEEGTYDPSYATAGVREFDCTPGAPSAEDNGQLVAVSGGRALAVGRRNTSPDDAVCVARLTSSLIFRSGFEGGDLWAWSSSAL